MTPVGPEQVEQRERKIHRIRLEDLAGRGERGFRGVAARGLGREIAQRLQPPLAEHPIGGLGAGDQHSADAARLVADRAVREDEVALLGEAVPVQRKEEVLEADGTLTLASPPGGPTTLKVDLPCGS